ncbi:hypothetical protein [Halorussus litoreus]|uniref:hypothetical protein n=1 Tax=Halorussus litoreus TaxID=1710536 RepID=UPI001E53C045|nr:hypothetical protein [Halorussus litoreus]
MNAEHSTMPRISQSTTLEQVEHILGSGSGILDFAVEGENDYYTWEDGEDANWKIEDVDCVKNVEEDRFIMFPEGDSFTCEIETEEDKSRVRCWCE